MMQRNDASPLVTVIAACYNHEKYLLECLNGIEKQSYPNIQLIIVDDASKDHSVDLINFWLSQSKKKAIFIKHEKNEGICKSLNEAMKYAEGKYIAITSTDDIWLFDRISNQVEILEKSSEKVGVVYSDAFTINEYGTLLKNSLLDKYLKVDKPPQGNIFPLLM